jgi:DNA polymerase-3 subunit gamma/tau
LNTPASSSQGAPEQTDLDQPNPAMVQLTSLTSIVDLAETNGEMLLAARIRNHVRLVSLKPGNLQMALTGAVPDELASDIARFLSQWTGQRWLVSLSEFGGEETLAENQRESDEKFRDTITSEPIVARILDIFPGASIDEIKAPETAATNIITGSNDTLLRANTDDEEISG